MMRFVFSLAAIALCLMIGLPATATAGNGETGACLFDDPDRVPALNLEEGNIIEVSICIDGLDPLECAAICEVKGDDPGGGIGICEFLPGQTCASTKIPWDGACDDVNFLPIGDLCLLLFSGDPDESALLCEEKGFGTWLGAGSVCGGVPAMPKLAYGALALVLLAGTLTLLTLQNRS